MSSSDRNRPVPTLLIGPGQIVISTLAKSARHIGQTEYMEGKENLLIPSLLNVTFLEEWLPNTIQAGYFSRPIFDYLDRAHLQG
jgi:hypothetical protein